MANTAFSVKPSSSTRISISVSIGSLPRSLAIWASVFPWMGSSFGFCDHGDEDRLGSGDLLPLVVPRGVRREHVLLDPRAHRRILEALEHLLVAAVVRPRRDERRRAVEPGGIGVGVRADLHPAAPRRVDLGDDPRHQSPLRFAGGLQVPDLHGDVGFAPYPDRFVDRREDRRALRPHVRGVHAAVLRRRLRERDQFLACLRTVRARIEGTSRRRPRRRASPRAPAPSCCRVRPPWAACRHRRVPCAAPAWRPRSSPG